MEEYKSYCPICKKETIFNIEVVETNDPVLGVPVKSHYHVCTCSVCGCEIQIPKFNNQDEKEAFEGYKRIKGMVSGEEIRKLREKYGLSSSSFASLLGLGEKTLIRYENGDIQTKEIDTLLHLMENEQIFLYLYNQKKESLTSFQQEKVNRALGLSSSQIKMQNVH